MTTYGIDVANYQSADLSQYQKLGAQFAIVKVTQGTNYVNPVAQAQIASAKRLGMTVAGYFFAQYSADANRAKAEANFAVSKAMELGLPTGSVLAVDWENNAQYNSVWGPKVNNTDAALTAMAVIAKAGYKPMLYGSVSDLSHVDTARVHAAYPYSLWVAAYPVSGAQSEPLWQYQPSLTGMAIWQFTSQWHGLGLDANVIIKNPFDASASQAVSMEEEAMWQPKVKYNELGQFKAFKEFALYTDSTLTKQNKTAKAGAYKILKAKDGAVMLGANQWASQADGLTKINPLAVNKQAPAIAEIVDDQAYTQNDTKPSNGIKHLPKGSKWRVLGRKGKYLLVGNDTSGKYLDGDKALIVL